MKKIISSLFLMLISISGIQAQVSSNTINFYATDTSPGAATVDVALKTADGSIYVAGGFTTIQGQVTNIKNFAKINPDGTLNTEFDLKINGGVRKMISDKQGNIYVAGDFTEVDGLVRTNLFKLNTNGTVDVNFRPVINGYVSSLALDSIGNLYISGGFTEVNGIGFTGFAKFKSNGIIDSDFLYYFSEGYVRTLLIGNADELYVGGDYKQLNYGVDFEQINTVDKFNHLIQIKADGSINTNFSQKFEFNFQNSIENASVESLAMDKLGNLFVGGRYTAINGVNRNHIAKINSNGTVNKNFNPNADGGVYTLALDGQGSIYLGGLFNKIGSVNKSGLAKVKSDGYGNLDIDFNPNYGFNDFVTGLNYDSSGDLLVAGSFDKNFARFKNCVTPTFTPIATICSENNAISPLPTTSQNGIDGTWSPAFNNNVTSNYIFTPSLAQCGTTANITVYVNPNSPCNNPTTTIANCGGTIQSFFDRIYANPIKGVEGYKFEVTYDGLVRTYEVAMNKSYSFRMSYFSDFVPFNSEASVRVALKTNGTFGQYGSACTIKTPALVPSTKIQSSQCGITLPSYASRMYCDVVYGASMYKFEVTYNGNIRTFETPSNSFRLKNFPNFIGFNGTFSVRVAIKNNGMYEPYGTACTISTGAARFNETIEDEHNSEITLFSYPNPYTDTFKLDYYSPSNNEVKVMVYDILGKLVETRSFNAIEIYNQEFGANYNNGIYNVLIEQDGITKSTRIIKK